MNSDDDFTVLMPRSSAMPPSAARPRQAEAADDEGYASREGHRAYSPEGQSDGDPEESGERIYDRAQRILETTAQPVFPPPRTRSAPPPASAPRSSTAPRGSRAPASGPQSRSSNAPSARSTQAPASRPRPQAVNAAMSAPAPTIRPDFEARLAAPAVSNPELVNDAPTVVMSAQAVQLARPETFAPRAKAWVRARRRKIITHAAILLTLGCAIGVGTEVLIQRRGVQPPVESSALITSVNATTLSTPETPSPPTTLSAASIASAQMQCTTSSEAKPATSATPAATVTAAAVTNAAPADTHRKHRTHAPDVAQAAKPADPVAAPQDDLAAAHETLTKAKEETPLP